MAIIRREYPTAVGLLLTIINLIFALILFFVGVRFILKAFGANPFNTFVNWIYGISQIFIAPFAGIFPTEAIRGGYIIEFSAIFAFIIYLLLVYLINWAISRLSYEEVT